MSPLTVGPGGGTVGPGGEPVGPTPSSSSSGDDCTAVLAYEDPLAMTSSEPWILLEVPDPGSSPATSSYLHASQSGKPLNQSLTEPAGTYGGRKRPMVGDFGTPRRVMSDPITGQWPAQRQELSDDDAARLTQAFRAAHYRDLRNAIFRQYLTSHDWRLLGGTPRLLFEGLVDTDPLSSHLQHRLSVSDVIGNAYKLHINDVQIPQRAIPGANVTGGGAPVFGSHDFPGFADPDVRNPRRVPIIPGPCSGESLSPVQCVVPLICVGPFLCADAVTRIAGLVSGHAHTGGVLRLSQPDGTNEGLIPSGDANAWWPGKPSGWSTVNPSGAALYTDINGHRYTLCFFDGQRGDDFKTGSRPIYANVRGPDTNADGTGTEMTDAFELKKWLWLNWIEPTPGYQSGPWLASSTFENYPGDQTLCRINTASFARSSAIANLYNGGGFLWGGYIGPQGRGRREVIADMNRSSWSMTTFNQYWQITDVMLDRRRSSFLRTTKALDAYGRRGIQREPAFVPDDPRSAWHATNVRVLYAQNPRTNQYLGDIQLSSSTLPNAAAAFLKYGTIYQEITLPFVSDTATATAIQQQMVDFMLWMPKAATWCRRWDGLEDDIGDGRAITHPAGPYTDEAFLIVDQSDQINRSRVLSTGIYVDHLLTY